MKRAVAAGADVYAADIALVGEEEPSARHNLQGYTKQNKAAARKCSDNQCNSGRYSCSNPAAKVEVAETGACGGTAAVGACGGRPPGEQERVAQAVAAQLGSTAAPAAQQQKKGKTRKVATGSATGGTTGAEGSSCI
ncbi:unnamed protein product [Closterium sp. NIES-54]